MTNALQTAVNSITAHIRPRNPKNQETLDGLTNALMRIWDETVRDPATPKRPADTAVDKHGPRGRLDDPFALHAVFILDDIAAGAEQGFVMPVAGNDQQWAREHMPEFEARAAAGDEAMEMFVKEVKDGLGKGLGAKL